MVLSKAFHATILSYTAFPNAEFLLFFLFIPLISFSPSWIDAVEKLKCSCIIRHWRDFSSRHCCYLGAAYRATAIFPWLPGTCGSSTDGTRSGNISARLRKHISFLSVSNALNILLLSDSTAAQNATSSKHCNFLCEIFLEDVHSKNHTWNLCSANSSSITVSIPAM